MKKLLIILALILAPHSAFAAIAYGHANTASLTAGGTSKTWNHTATGDNLLIVTFTLKEVTLAPTGVGCTYAGVTMTQINSEHAIATYHSFRFQLASPTTGLNSVICSWTNDQLAAFTSDSYSGADGGVDATSETCSDNGAPFTTFSTTVVSAVNDLVFGSLNILDGTAAPAWSAPATARGRTGAGSNFQAATGDEAGAASVTIDGTIAPAVMSICAFNIKATAAVASTPQLGGGIWGA